MTLLAYLTYGQRCFVAAGMPVVYTQSTNERTVTVLVELNPWASPGPVAQPLPALAHGNLFRLENGQDWLCGVLGIHGAGKKTATPLPEVDR